MTTSAALTLGLLLAAWGQAGGMQTETSASNKPPYSFYCKITAGAGGKVSFCASGEKPYVKINDLMVYRNFNDKVGNCIVGETAQLILRLTQWFNEDCSALSEEDQSSEAFHDYVGDLMSTMKTQCNIENPNVHKVVVEYDCVRSVELNATRQPRPSLAPTSPVTRPSVTDSTGIKPLTAPSLPVKTTPGVSARPGPADEERKGSTPTLATQPPTKTGGGGLNDTSIILMAILIPFFILILVGVLLYFLCKRRRAENKRQQHATLGSAKSSATFLMPSLYKTAGDDLSGVVYGGSAITNDYSQYPSDSSRRSVDRDYTGVHRSSQVSRADNVQPYLYFGNDGNGKSDLASVAGLPEEQRGVDAPDSRDGNVDSRSRRSSADPEMGFYDRRLSDRKLIVLRHPSESSARSSVSAAAENRKLSRTSYAELPSDRRASGESATSERKISLSLSSPEERRLSDGFQATQNRRPTTYGGPAMPEIRESHENDVFYSNASRFFNGSDAYNKETDNPSLLARMSWGGVIDSETNYSYWPPEWQRWLKNRPSCI